MSVKTLFLFRYGEVFWRGDGVGVGGLLCVLGGGFLGEGERGSGYAGKLVLDPMLIFSTTNH